MSGGERTAPSTQDAPGMARCFVGLPLPPEWQDRLAALRDELSVSGHASGHASGDTSGDVRDPALADLLRRLRWTPPGNWHLTLRFLGDVPASRCGEVADALKAIPFAPVTLAVGGAGVFPARGAPRVLWLGLARGARECAAMAGAVDAALVPLGFAPDARPFAPHLTLARLREAHRPDRRENDRPGNDHQGHGRRGGESPSPPSPRAAWEARDALLAAVDARVSRSASPWPGCTVRDMVLWRSDLGGAHPVYTPLAVLPART